MSLYSALVQPLPSQSLTDVERRLANRHSVSMEALSRPLEGQDTIWWGATVRDLSSGGIGLILCYPFKPGAYLAIDLQGPGGGHSFLTRVVHVRDLADGTWHIGCEFVKKLTDSEVEVLI